ncbi:hypothetical protein EST38_g11265 [Candolleomyces aberdarensis]|uniref:PHD-type domain-containing protein n=1 Tax=Candolleomyces aberdarensis TaxID=2316362 RepID=A0A4Q2D5B6_9AGAR|nr:hypothetical protein EST38_g11265 [Candolleomyces aberdarensis]
MAKATTSDRNKRTLPNPGSSQPQDIFSPVNPGESQNSANSQSALANFVLPGGEMERIRQAERENVLAFTREAEARRPDYLKRTKHDSNAMDEDGERPVGIMETPVKGRRLKLFQETSEESFEESLMAGGYGRYRTADWVRQPQPISFPAGIAGASNIIQKLEAVEEVPEQPPTEKELKKRKRLEAFRSNRSEGSLRSKLYPVELEGKGRVLLDIPNEMPVVPPSPDPSPSKRRNTRRKKKSVEIPSKDKRTALEQATAFAGEDTTDKPNWPDAEFPWRLRTEERAEAAKAEEEERLKWIERFLDAESDEEDEPAPPPSQSDSDSGGRNIQNLPPPRMGRGKMVPLLSHPEDPRKAYQKKRTTFPTDPGDALAALLAKRSVRALSYRQMRRQREMNEDNEDLEELCICRGTDDGRELVQCDDCRTWYHLACIGIRDITELGREEDPWFCRRCMTRSRSPSSEPEVMRMSEPTFAPTDEAPRERSSDATLYHPSLQDSPNWMPPSRIPKTPTRGHGHLGPLAWPDPSSRHAPTTPKGQNHRVKVHTQHTPSSYDGFRVIHEETPFDPNSTPSRGLRFSGPLTPKTNSMWSGRPSAGGPLFQTPSRPTHNRGIGNRSFGGPGSLSAALDDMGSRADSYYQNFGPQRPIEESPMRRTKSRDAATARRQLQPYSSMSVLEESPVMRNKGKERLVEGTTRF